MSDLHHSPDPRVSVVITCFNYGRYLADAVASVIGQTFTDHETIIVDDGSSDDSCAVARGLIASHPSAAITLIAQDNCGVPGRARNVGIARAHGEYIVCLDADDVLDRGYLQACAGALDGDPDVGVAYGDIQAFERETWFTHVPVWDARRECDSNFLGSPTMFRRAAWERRPYDETRGLVGYEDWDFWVSCVEGGWSGVKAPGARFNYRVHGTGSVFETNVARDPELKARIISNHPGLYTAGQRRWADAVLAGDPSAAPTGRIKMPGFADVPAPPAATVGRELPVRSVCLITKDYPPVVPGGIPRAVQMQARMLAAAGVRVHVITRSGSGRAGTRLDGGVLIHEITEPAFGGPAELYYIEAPVWAYAVASKFAELDAAERFDVVETPDWRGEALHLAPRPETALVCWLHTTMRPIWDCDPDYVRSPGDDAWHALEMAALQRADLLIAPSRLLAETTATLLGERMRPVKIVPYLFEAAAFPAKPAGRAPGPLRILFYGRLEQRKNPEAAMHAVAVARGRGLDVELRLLGRDNGGHVDRVVRPLQQQLGLDDMVFVPEGGVETVRAELAAADVVILPSRFDNSPLTVFESLAIGVPVITSDRVGTATWIAPQDGLLALPVEDVESFASRAADALADAEWLASGLRAAARMRETFDPARVADQLLECYGELMARREVAPYRVVAEEPVRPPTRLVAAELPVAPARIEGARSQAVVCFGDELVDDPELLGAWARAFTGADDITLVIYAPQWSGKTAAARLHPLVSRFGLDGEDAPDLLALATPATPELEDQLVRGAAAVLTRRRLSGAFAAMETVDDASLARLEWTAREPVTA